jgi:eukaryotic-like serine/threonine-protein kinase
VALPRGEPASLLSTVPLEAGIRLGRFEIVAPIGAGGMGEVYRARDTSLGREVAIKVLPTGAEPTETALRRFHHEARIISTLNHPNIVTILDYGQSERGSYIVTELVKGETLRQRTRRGKLQLQEALHVAVQVCAALSAAHAEEIVHRDIKLENVMLRHDGYVKVLDFGIAKLAHGAEGVSEAETVVTLETRPGLVFGTANCMSPEQARGLPVDARSDIFSFGVLLYELFTGRKPFDGPSTTDVMVAILDREPKPPSHVVVELPTSLDSIIMKCLQKNREQRYQAAGELMVDLKALTMLISSSSMARPALDSTPSIAVLPFVNMSADPENEYFCDGLSEELLNLLAKIEDLRVAARTSSFSFKGKETDVREIGRRLSVSTVLEGSVRRSGSRIRISAQLVNIGDGYHLWSERYDRQMEDVFDVQDEIAKAIVDALTAKLVKSGAAVPELKVQPASPRPVSLEAHQAFLKGRFYWNQRTWESIAHGIECFSDAIAGDPLYAPAYVGLADSLNLLGYYSERPPKQAYPRAKAAAMQALAIDPASAEAHASLAYATLFYDWDWEAADREFRRAIELNPEYASAHQWYGWYCFATGDLDRAVENMRRAHVLDPLAPIISAHLALALMHTGKHDLALRSLAEALELNPGFAIGHMLTGLTYVDMGNVDVGIESLAKAVELSHDKFGLGRLGHAYGVAGRSEQAEQVLQRLTALASERYMSPLEFAFVNAGLGRYDESLADLARAADDRASDLIRLRLLPWPDAVRASPRFEEIAAIVGVR